MSQIANPVSRHEPPSDEFPPETKQKTPPVDSKRFDRVQAAIWRREHADGRSSFSVTFSRSYLVKIDGKEEWRSTDSFDPRDMPFIKLAADWAMQQLLLKPE